MALVVMVDELAGSLEDGIRQEIAWHDDARAEALGITPEFAAGFRAGLEQAAGLAAQVVASLAVERDGIEG